MSLFKQSPIVLDLPDAEVTYYPDFLSKKEATQYFDSIYKDTKWQQDDIKVFGKTYLQPRLTALYASNKNSYSYSNITMYPEVFTFALSEIKTRIEKIVDVTFTSCLLNLYRDGKDSNGWHSDDEKELGKNPIIASVSLGEDRVFKMRNKTDKQLQTKLILSSGSLLLMKGKTQHHWQHQIPKTSKKVAPRINLTYRIISNKI